LKASYDPFAPESLRTRYASRVFKEWLQREMAVFAG
jgi:hypothetical protein